MSSSDLERMNREGAEAVKAVRATSTKLSRPDQAMMLEVAQGGIMQLELSRMAVQKATSPEVKRIAQAEVEEQTLLANKLKEIAQAKGVSMPNSSDGKATSIMQRMGRLSGAEFDRMYLQESGVRGHEMLDKVMSRVESEASDDGLKSLAAAAHPLVRTHLQVAQQMLDTMGGSGRSGR